MFSRRTLVPAAAVAASAPWPGLRTARAAASQRPNVGFVVGDEVYGLLTRKPRAS